MKQNLWVAINYIHSKGIAHCGLSLETFIMDSNNKVLIQCFDFPCISKSNFDKTMGSLLCGVIDYMSPEMVGFTDNICYDAKALDIYALGVILFEMINFCKPFVEYMNELIINKVYIERQVNRDYKYKPEIDPNIWKAVKDLIHKLLEPNSESLLKMFYLMNGFNKRIAKKVLINLYKLIQIFVKIISSLLIYFNPLAIFL